MFQYRESEMNDVDGVSLSIVQFTNIIHELQGPLISPDPRDMLN